MLMKGQLKAMIEASMFFNFGAGFFTPVYAVFVKNIGGSLLDAGIAWALYSIFLGVFVFVFGKLEDKKLDKKKMVVIGYLILSASTLGYIIISSPFHLFILQAIIGLASGMLIPGWFSLYERFIDKGKEASEWAYWSGGKSIVIGIAAFLGGAIVQFFGWNALFMVMFVFQFSAALIIAFFLKDKKK